MVCDLYYFYESDLDKNNLEEFHDTLPRQLQIKFRASLHGIRIAKGNVLQGYRGPSGMCNGGSGSQELRPSQGLQEIKFLWGARKDMNFVPVVGTGLFLIERGWHILTDELDWSSLFFDSETGECVGHDRREAAEKLNSRRRRAESKPQARSFNYDRGNAHENREEYYVNMITARDEAHAENLNFQGDQLFDRGEYIFARGKYEKSLHLSEEHGPRQKYMRNLRKAQLEIDAKERFYEGNRLFQMDRFRQAEEEYHAAYVTSNEPCACQIYTDSEEKARIEECALPFVHEGDNLFYQGRFEEAISRYERAIDISQVHGIIQIYRASVDKAHYEIDAMNLNSEGDNLFNKGRYWEARDKYEKAYNLSKVREGIYKANTERAKVEYAALQLNFDGVHLFNQGKYNDAVGMYQLACNKSQVGAQIQKYKANIAKAQVEIDALKLNSQGDSFLNVGRYNDALSMYRKAYDTYQITKQKNVYLSNKNQAHDVISKLYTLHTLWKQAWDVGNDTKADRSAEAKDLFLKILSESEENLKTFPENSKFQQFKALAVLKIEGNELFNEGVISQGNGMKLLEEAQELNQQQKYQLANQKFKEAKKYFQGALEKFEKDSNSDQRFTACIGFVQDLVNEVMDSIKIAEQCMFSERLNKLDITSDNHFGAHSRETNVTGKDINYSRQI